MRAPRRARGHGRGWNMVVDHGAAPTVVVLHSEVMPAREQKRFRLAADGHGQMATSASENGYFDASGRGLLPTALRWSPTMTAARCRHGRNRSAEVLEVPDRRRTGAWPRARATAAVRSSRETERVTAFEAAEAGRLRTVRGPICSPTARDAKRMHQPCADSANHAWLWRRVFTYADVCPLEWPEMPRYAFGFPNPRCRPRLGM